MLTSFQEPMELPERPGAAMNASKSARERHLGGQDGQLGAQVASSWRPGASEIPQKNGAGHLFVQIGPRIRFFDDFRRNSDDFSSIFADFASIFRRFFVDFLVVFVFDLCCSSIVCKMLFFADFVFDLCCSSIVCGMLSAPTWILWPLCRFPLGRLFKPIWSSLETPNDKPIVRAFPDRSPAIYLEVHPKACQQFCLARSIRIV